MLPYKHSRFFPQYARLYNAAASPASRLRSAGLVGNDANGTKFWPYKYGKLKRPPRLDIWGAAYRRFICNNNSNVTVHTERSSKKNPPVFLSLSLSILYFSVCLAYWLDCCHGVWLSVYHLSICLTGCLTGWFAYMRILFFFCITQVHLLIGNCEEELPEKHVGRLSVGRLSAICWSTVGQQTADSRPTVSWQVLP